MRQRALATLVLLGTVCASCGTQSVEVTKPESSVSATYAEKSDYLPVDQRSIAGGVPLATVNGATIPTLAADWSALDGGEIPPPSTLQWPKLQNGTITLSVATSAIPLSVEVNKFDSVMESGIPNEEGMDYIQCSRIEPGQDMDGQPSGCTYSKTADGVVNVVIHQPPKYMVVSSTWYPNLGNDEINSSKQVAASWALSAE